MTHELTSRMSLPWLTKLQCASVYMCVCVQNPYFIFTALICRITDALCSSMVNWTLNSCASSPSHRGMDDWIKENDALPLAHTLLYFPRVSNIAPPLAHPGDCIGKANIVYEKKYILIHVYHPRHNSARQPC